VIEVDGLVDKVAVPLVQGGSAGRGIVGIQSNPVIGGGAGLHPPALPILPLPPVSPAAA